jgi:FKBP-type peptidyl-prolyl cis-trans isomerase
VSSRNRTKRIQNRETRLTAMEEAKRRARRRRWEIATGGVVLALIIAIGFVVRSGDDTKKSSTKTGCVAVSDPLPKGAPKVPVKIGPPPTKLVKEDLKKGDGAVVKAGATVTVDYIGVACSTGKIFDSSYKTGTPATFSLSQVIKGWTDGIPGMKVGGQRLLGIPADLAYGATGSPPAIGPNEALWFVVSVQSTQ